MPGPFTHIYTARRVAEFLESEGVTKEFLRARDGKLLPDQWLASDLIDSLGTKVCAKAMKDWQKFTAVGAIGPDLFFWLQDYNIPEIKCDEIMLAMSLLYYLDDEGFLEDPFDGLLKILATAVPDSWGKILLFIVRLHDIYLAFKKVWDSTIGQLAQKAGQVLDDLAGGLLTSLGQILEQLKNDIIALVAEELLTEADIFGWFSLKMRKGYDEQAFVWSDMTHYRRTSVVPARMIQKASNLIGSESHLDQEHGQQLLAFALGWVCHVGTDVIAHSFVNEQCGGPFRTHWQRHHLIENHIDAYNYECTGNGVLPADDFCGWQPSYQSVADSALYFAVQIPQDIDNLEPDQKLGDLRQPLPDDDGDVVHEEQRKVLLDTDGALPLWLAETISKTFIEVYGAEKDGGDMEIQDTKAYDKGKQSQVPHPMNLKGQDWQDKLNKDTTLISQWLATLGIQNIPIELENLREIIAPDSATGDMGFKTPAGFPFPWEIQVAYRFMLSWFKRSFMSTFNMPCPQPPKVFTPPLSDIPKPTPPDFSGINPNDDPISQGCGVLAAVLDWFVKQVEAIGQFIYDIIKSIASAATYPLREEIYEHITLPMWEAGEAIRMVLCHLGYFMPQSGQNWPGTTDMKYPNEIDEQLIRLGHSVDTAFQQALADSFDVLGNLDRDPNLNLDGVRDVLNQPNPWLPIRTAPGSDFPPHVFNIGKDNIVEFLRPWAYPDKNNETDLARNGNFLEGPLTVPGPYPRDIMPHQMFTSTRAISNLARVKYQQAGCPNDTLLYSKAYIRHENNGRRDDGWEETNPLGDPIPFSAYLMGQIACNPNFISLKDSKQANFNLDADRGYGYLCWDWTRSSASKNENLDGRDNAYPDPVTWPEGSFPDHNKWLADVAKGMGANMHSQVVGGTGGVIQDDVQVSYFGRDGCKETGKGPVEEPPSIK